MDTEQLQKDSFDFFEKNSMPIDKSSKKSVHIGAMILYTLSQIFKPKTIFYTCISAAMLITPIKYFSHASEKSVLEQKKVELETMKAQSLKIKEEAMKAKADELKDKELYKMIKNVSREDINSTLEFIDATQAKELKKLNTLYWSMVYMRDSNEEDRINMEEVNKRMQATLTSIKTHYTYRKKEILTTYELVQHDQYAAIERTYDDHSSAKMLINYLMYNKTKSEITQSETDEIYKDWMSILKNPTALALYLEKNKALIDKAEFVK